MILPEERPRDGEKAMAAGHDDIPEIALDWHRTGQGAALATVASGEPFTAPV